MCQIGTKIILTALLEVIVNCVNAPELLLLLENIVFWISHLVLLGNNKDGIPHGAEENETEGEGDADLVVVSIMEGGHCILLFVDVHNSLLQGFGQRRQNDYPETIQWRVYRHNFSDAGLQHKNARAPGLHTEHVGCGRSEIVALLLAQLL